MEDKLFEFNAIGTVHSMQKYRFETPRQGAFSESDGFIELFSPYGGDAVADLDGCQRIWVIFCFHLNYGRAWKARVKPPLPVNGVCRSVFATRSPYRPNPIGISCVELAGIEGNRLFLRHIDMLDGTPVLDIKPYIPEADAFQGSLTGWRDAVPNKNECLWELVYSEKFLQQAAFILREGALDLVNFAEVQLANEPLDASRKRVKKYGDDLWSLGCRTWKIIFSADQNEKCVNVKEIISNYTSEELAVNSEDRYCDKDLHRKFFRNQ